MELVGFVYYVNWIASIRVSHSQPQRFMVAIFLSIFGVITIVPLSLGNNPNSHGPKQLAVALLMTLLYSL